MDDVSAATGRSVTFAIRPGGRCLFACTGLPQVKMPQVSGLTQQPASTAICSMSFDKLVASSTSVTSLRKPVAFSIFTVSILNRSQGDQSRQRRPAHRNQHGGCSTCQNPLQARSLKSISANVALRRCTKQTHCAFTLAATI